MKNIILSLFVFVFSNLSFGQTVISSCEAPDNIIEMYQSDADRLTIRAFYDQNSIYMDSIEIPEVYSDTVLEALIAVYNAIGLPERDSVVSIFDIHSFPNPTLNGFMVKADSSLAWMIQLKQGITPTGVSEIDSLMDLYDLTINDYSTLTFGNPGSHLVVFDSKNINITALSNVFLNMEGVEYVDPNGWAGDGNNITSTVDSDHVELIYSFGWGDCPSGCIYRHYWKFKVYFDCSVEFVSSYGSIIPGFFLSETSNEPVLFPNPFTNHLQIKNVEVNSRYKLYNTVGQLLSTGKLNSEGILSLEFLPNGAYLLVINSTNSSGSFRILKN